MSGPDLRAPGLKSRAELSTGPEGRGGLGGLTGTHPSTAGKGTDTTNLWYSDGRGARRRAIAHGRGGRRCSQELLGLTATGLTGTQMAGDADPHYVQTLDAHTSEGGPGGLWRHGGQVSCVRTGVITTELQNGTNSEGALREQCVFLLSRVGG